jgi:hypothetical protein
MNTYFLLLYLVIGFSAGSLVRSPELNETYNYTQAENSNNSVTDTNFFGTRNRALPHDLMNIFEPAYIRQSPGNEATIINAGKGVLKIFYINRPGNADKMMSIESLDNGLKWSDPVEEFSLPGEAYYANNVVRDQNGELHCVFHIFEKGENGYNGRHLDIWYCHTENKCEKWSSPEKIYSGYVGSIRGFIQLKNNRLLLVFARAVPERSQKPEKGETDYGWNEIISMYSDDLGGTWLSSENGVNIPVESTQVTRYGGVEPVVIELNSNKLWMLIRTNKGYLYESFSDNSGKTWSPPERTNFISSDSPADLLRLSDGRIVMMWSGNKRWDDDRSYANGGREVLHAAISNDDGKTWKGYREVLVSPSGHFIVKRDIGTAYPSAVETEEKKVLFLSGQAEERAIAMFDPDWLEKSTARDNFTEGLSQWSLFGADSTTCLTSLPSNMEKSALIIKKSISNRDHDTEAVWNFPMTKKGKLIINVFLNEESKGINLALTDHFSVSYDTKASQNSAFSCSLDKNKDGLKTGNLKVAVKWDCSQGKAFIYLNNKMIKEITYGRKAVNGLNYLRVGIPGNEPDSAGYFIKSVKILPER